jgi:hypothetical protein
MKKALTTRAEFRLATLLLTVLTLMAALSAVSIARAAGPIIVDHTATNITLIPQAAIEAAITNLHIAYGHTSHGSQVTDGMSGLVAFANDGGLGLALPTDTFAWNNGGSGGALDLHDYAMAGDVGYYPQWVDNTRSYLNNPDHADVNVIIWSWCGQASGYTAQQMIDRYLAPMSQLETEYPDVTFVYMTGHADGTGETGNLHLRNQQIRDYCIANNKVLYDFYDLECHDPDGNYYGDKLVTDACDYDSDGDGSRDRNWAVDWQSAHTQGVDWYRCGSAHTQPLNANQKAYAAWWLWSRIAGWGACVNAPSGLTAVADADLGQVVLQWTDNADNEDSFIIQRQVGASDWNTAYATVAANATTYTEVGLGLGTYHYRVVAHRNDDGSGSPCDSSASNSVSAVIAISVPAAPSDLTSTVNGFDIALTWTDNSDNENAFVVERSVDRGDYMVIAPDLDADAQDYTDSNLVPLSSYSYRVKAVNSFGDSDYSNETSQYIPNGAVTVTLNNHDAGEIADAFLLSTAPDINYGSTSYTTTYDRFIVQFNLPAEVMGKKILSAELSLYVWAVDPDDAGTGLDVYRVLQAWDESAVTWTHASAGLSWDTLGGTIGESVGKITVEYLDHQFLTPMDVSATVQQWVDGSLPNHGLMLDKGPDVGMGLKASEYSQEASPTLSITYTNRDCPGDADGDGDVDGADLAQLAQAYDPICLNAFAVAFGL